MQRALNFAIVDEVDSISDRRSAHAADHLPARPRTTRAMYLAINAVHTSWCARKGRPTPHRRGRDQAGDFTRGRKSPPGLPDRAGPRTRRAHSGQGRPAARRRFSCTTAQHHADAPFERRAARPPHLTTATSTTWCRTAKVVIVDEFTGRLMPRPPLERGPAPGRRSQGRRAPSSPKTRRWPRSPSRTTSACTTSCPA